MATDKENNTRKLNKEELEIVTGGDSFDAKKRIMG